MRGSYLSTLAEYLKLSPNVGKDTFNLLCLQQGCNQDEVLAVPDKNNWKRKGGMKELQDGLINQEDEGIIAGSSGLSQQKSKKEEL